MCAFGASKFHGGLCLSRGRWIILPKPEADRRDPPEGGLAPRRSIDQHDAALAISAGTDSGKPGRQVDNQLIDPGGGQLR